MFSKNQALELLSLPQFHKLVRIPRIAVFAAELAPAVRVDAPLERHLTPCCSSDKPSRFQVAVLDAALRFQRVRLGCQARDADQSVSREFRKQHETIFAICSPQVKRLDVEVVIGSDKREAYISDHKCFAADKL